ncbi:hypothetical protein [Chromobacterium haemolyticum]|uniref:hypothetical protein n=1 Tax=Chromobacterium haemolyticum TaxID=394935 RepID=UPI002447A358|nr:hypothetical protein [Chromobacterium haemolyticum]MDH0341905.1 hypothetical protein [Chromobacterium haemolyticum]
MLPCNTHIYIDTKITGTIYQLANYFHAGVFDQNTLVLIKKYKAIEKKFSAILERLNIPYQWIERNSQIDALDNGIIFYPFNAQSNCRVVANRKMIHVFITHGESNKKSSIKPITRIYDFIIVAGEAGIDRYLHNGIFSVYDRTHGRLIKLGNTFSGGLNGHFTLPKDGGVLFYAPTWEGGLESENYSSLTNIDNFSKLKRLANRLEIKCITIQTHPNLGHRSQSHMNNLWIGIFRLLQAGLEVRLVQPYHSMKVFTKLFNFFEKFRILPRGDYLKIAMAITDVSAMEIQCLVADIPVCVLIKNEPHPDFFSKRQEKHYSIFGVRENEEIPSVISHEVDTKSNIDVKKYYISYEHDFLAKMPPSSRIEWLSNIARENLKNARFLSY